MLLHGLRTACKNLSPPKNWNAPALNSIWMGTRHWQGLLMWTHGSRDPQQGTTCLYIEKYWFWGHLLWRRSQLTQMVAPASSVPLVERTWVLFFPHLQCISIDRRSPRVLVLLKGYRMSQKKCTLSRPFTFHAWAMFCKKKTSVRCRWSCPITLQSLCHSSCLADNQIRWVIALSRTSADSHRWAALALTTGAQILHDWLP